MLNRLLHAGAALFGVLVFGYASTVFFYGANKLPIGVLSDTSYWLMFGVLIFMGIVNFGVSGFFLFRMLDELFMDQSDTRRLTGTRA